MIIRTLPSDTPGVFDVDHRMIFGQSRPGTGRHRYFFARAAAEPRERALRSPHHVTRQSASSTIA